MRYSEHIVQNPWRELYVPKETAAKGSGPMRNKVAGSDFAVPSMKVKIVATGAVHSFALPESTIAKRAGTRVCTFLLATVTLNKEYISTFGVAGGRIYDVRGACARTTGLPAR